jgi:hypothetical protein
MSVVLPALTVLVVSLLVGSAWGQAGPSAGELLQMLHAGGYVIHHARRDEGGLVVSPNENNRRARGVSGDSGHLPGPRDEHAGRDPQAEHPRRVRQ